jgi:hypothetical protein
MIYRTLGLIDLEVLLVTRHLVTVEIAGSMPVWVAYSVQVAGCDA